MQKAKQQQEAFAMAAQFDDSVNSNNLASPEQRLNSMVKQFQEERNSPTFDVSQNNQQLKQQKQIKVTRGTGRVGGLRDSIILAREHLTHDHDENKNNGNNIMAAATLAASNLNLGSFDAAGLQMQQQKLQSSNSSLVRQLARVQQESQKHDLSLNAGANGALGQVDGQRQRAAQQVRHLERLPVPFLFFATLL